MNKELSPKTNLKDIFNSEYKQKVQVFRDKAAQELVKNLNKEATK